MFGHWLELFVAIILVDNLASCIFKLLNLLLFECIITPQILHIDFVLMHQINFVIVVVMASIEQQLSVSKLELAIHWQFIHISFLLQNPNVGIVFAFLDIV